MWLRMQAAYDLAQVRQHDGQIVVRRLGPSDAAQPARLAKQARMG
jgi:plasmid maintenance system antidote protein VapI